MSIYFILKKFENFQKNNEPKSKLPRLMGERARKEIKSLQKLPVEGEKDYVKES